MKQLSSFWYMYLLTYRLCQLNRWESQHFVMCEEECASGFVCNLSIAWNEWFTIERHWYSVHPLFESHTCQRHWLNSQGVVYDHFYLRLFDYWAHDKTYLYMPHLSFDCKQNGRPPLCHSTPTPSLPQWYTFLRSLTTPHKAQITKNVADFYMPQSGTLPIVPGKFMTYTQIPTKIELKLQAYSPMCVRLLVH